MSQQKFFLVVFADPAKRGAHTAAVLAQTPQWAAEKFAIANPDLSVLRVGRAISSRRSEV